MQDRQDGTFVPIDPDILKYRGMQEAMDAALPKKRQGPVFAIGEVLEIKGGKFRVQSIRTRGRLVLHGLPS